LEDPDAAIPHELGRQTPDPLREHLCRDHGVGLPRVAELACPILGVAPRHPVHLVRANARLVLACKEGLVALAQQLEYPLGNETLIEDEEAVPVPGSLVALELEPDEYALRMLLAFLERGAADEVVLGLQVDDERDARLERVDLVVELVAREDEA